MRAIEVSKDVILISEVRLKKKKKKKWEEEGGETYFLFYLTKCVNVIAKRRICLRLSLLEKISNNIL
jgi:hypothetical protein